MTDQKKESHGQGGMSDETRERLKRIINGEKPSEEMAEPNSDEIIPQDKLPEQVSVAAETAVLPEQNVTSEQDKLTEQNATLEQLAQVEQTMPLAAVPEDVEFLSSEAVVEHDAEQAGQVSKEIADLVTNKPTKTEPSPDQEVVMAAIANQAKVDGGISTVPVVKIDMTKEAWDRANDPDNSGTWWKERKRRDIKLMHPDFKKVKLVFEGESREELSNAA